MPQASRFAIKSNPELLILVVLSHVTIFIVGAIELAKLWFVLSIGLVLTFSFLYSFRQYLRLTQWHDDLCWSGESWLTTQRIQNQVSTHYLELKVSSWITSKFCLLKFDDLGNEHVWLFTRDKLGERGFSDLCFLAKMDLKHTKKLDIG